MNSTPAPPKDGFRLFSIIWGGQFFSLLGSGLISFALGVWVFESTGSTTDFALMVFFGMVPGLLISPIAGACVDRWNRQRTMIVSDFLAALTTVALLFMVTQDRLEIWHLYAIVGTTSLLGAFQQPAFLSLIPQLVPKHQLGRAAGLTQTGEAAPQILAPLLAGALLSHLHLAGILVIDLATATIAILCLLWVRLPEGAPIDQDDAGSSSLINEAIFGWKFIYAKSGLRTLLILFASVNLAMGLLQVLITPLILTLGSAALLGLVMAIGSAGFLLGSLVMVAWGGPKKSVRTILLLIALQGAILIIGGAQPEPMLIATAAFTFMFCTPLIAGSSQVIWQTQVEQHLMGRVFATRRLFALSSLPLAYLLAGPLADRIFEPAMAPGGALADTFGPWIGVGPGRGIGLIYMLLGAFLLCAALVAARNSNLRVLDQEDLRQEDATKKEDVP